MRARQPDLFYQLTSKSVKREQKRRTLHGGQSAKGKRKLQRPLATKKWIHLVLKSQKAQGKFSMLTAQNAAFIEKLVKIKSKKFSVEIKEFVNMGNHIHFQIRISTREGFQNFLRSITSLIARHVTGAKKGKRFGKFWQGLAFTRIISTYFELTGFERYLLANKIERKRGYNARERYLVSLNKWMNSLRASSA